MMGFRVWLFFVLGVTLALTGCAGSSRYMTESESLPPGPEQGKALIYFMRPSGFARPVNFQIYHGNKVIGVSQAKCYFAYQCDPGSHMFLAFAENQMGMKADVAAGKTYFVLTQAMMGGLTARVKMIPVTKGSHFWEKVATYQSKLKYIVADTDRLAGWQSMNGPMLRVKINKVTSYMNTPEGQKYVVHLSAEDGR